MLIYLKLTELSYHVSEKSYHKWNTKSLRGERREGRERERGKDVYFLSFERSELDGK